MGDFFFVVIAKCAVFRTFEAMHSYNPLKKCLVFHAGRRPTCCKVLDVTFNCVIHSRTGQKWHVKIDTRKIDKRNVNTDRLLGVVYFRIYCIYILNSNPFRPICKSNAL